MTSPLVSSSHEACSNTQNMQRLERGHPEHALIYVHHLLVGSSVCYGQAAQADAALHLFVEEHVEVVAEAWGREVEHVKQLPGG